MLNNYRLLHLTDELVWSNSKCPAILLFERHSLTHSTKVHNECSNCHFHRGSTVNPPSTLVRTTKVQDGDMNALKREITIHIGILLHGRFVISWGLPVYIDFTDLWEKARSTTSSITVRRSTGLASRWNYSMEWPFQILHFFQVWPCKFRWCTKFQLPQAFGD